MRTLSLARISFTLAVAFGGSQALAENWVTVTSPDEPIWGMVDKDSIRRGSDGLIYFQMRGGGQTDSAVDCQSRVMYTLKLHVMNGYDYPKWRDEGRAVVRGSAGEAALQYVCANG